MKDKFLSIERYGKRYVVGILQKQANKNICLTNSYEALKFFFSKSFYRGRRDEISKEFQDRAIKTLDGYYSGVINEIDYQVLESLLYANKVNNRKDREMVIAVIKFALKVNNHNVVVHSIDGIRNGKTEDVYNQLVALPEIGPKLAGLFLRDIVLLYDLKNFLTMDAEKYLQPVDTWVRQVAEKLGIISKGDKDPIAISMKIVNQCHDYSVCPLLFNAGAWYVGARSFELLWEQL
ncbi:MAG: hypothetical protein HY810_08470 [Candidatus Omnitrophica bacterium]|nr:hypothetical protein [Candidatus Omnitrophota bacterium]